MRRDRMSVRSTIQSSDVSTRVESSALVTSRSGRQLPVPTMTDRRSAIDRILPLLLFGGLRRGHMRLEIIEILNDPAGNILPHQRSGNTYCVGDADGVGSAVAFHHKSVQPQKHRSEEHTSELPSLMRISYDVFCLKK